MLCMNKYQPIYSWIPGQIWQTSSESLIFSEIWEKNNDGIACTHISC